MALCICVCTLKKVITSCILRSVDTCSKMISPLFPYFENTAYLKLAIYLFCRAKWRIIVLYDWHARNHRQSTLEGTRITGSGRTSSRLPTRKQRTIDLVISYLPGAWCEMWGVCMLMLNMCIIWKKRMKLRFISWFITTRTHWVSAQISMMNLSSVWFMCWARRQTHI